MTGHNPFPGMNPFFERHWRDAHTSLLMYLRDALHERLPPDLVAIAEEEVVNIGAGQRPVTYRPDVQIREAATLNEPGAMEAAPPSSLPTTSAEPIRVVLDEEIERWLEIRDQEGRLITALELLSPSNKLEAIERERYFRKRHTFQSRGVNFIEIDLVRQGTSVFATTIRSVLQNADACYGICVFRATRPEEREVYPIRLRERLPVIRIPLRPSDADVVLDLQPLIDQCHERGRYHLLNYHLALNPPLSPEDANWADQLLRQKHLL